MSCKFKNLSKLTMLAVIFGMIFLAADSAFAQIAGLTTRSMSEIISSAINWLLEITAGLAILFIIVGGIYYLTAAGDDQRMTAGKTIITYAVIGLAFVIVSYSIVATVNAIIAG